MGELGSHRAATGRRTTGLGFIGLTGLIGFTGFIGFIGFIGFVGFIGFRVSGHTPLASDQRRRGSRIHRRAPVETNARRL